MLLVRGLPLPGSWVATDTEDPRFRICALRCIFEVDLRDTSGLLQFPLRHTLKVRLRDTSGIASLRRPEGLLRDVIPEVSLTGAGLKCL